MNQPPLNPDALEAGAKALFAVQQPEVSAEYAWNVQFEDGLDELRNEARAAVSAYLSVAQPEVNSVEELKALPIGSVILDGGGDAGIIEPGAILFTETNPLSPEYVAKHYLPARVLYRPEVKP